MSRPLLLLIYLLLALILTCRVVFSSTASSSSPDLETSSGAIRKQLIEVNSQIFQAKAASLVNGVLWGDKSSFTRKDLTLLKASGLTHIAVASGMNLVLLTGVLTLILPKRRYLNISIALIVASIYTFITGFQSPIVRALLMLAISNLAILTGRPSARFSGLILAGYIILLQSPSQITSVSFQLSFLATAGQLMISTFTATIKHLDRFIISDLTQTIMAQLLTLPITVLVFGNYAIGSIVVNALVLWTVSWIMIMGAIAGFTGWIFVPLGRLVTLPLEGLSFYFWQVVGFFGSQSGAMLRVPKLDPAASVPYYLMIIGGYLWLKRKLASD